MQPKKVVGTDRKLVGDTLDRKTKMCIYQIEHTESGKKYIGQTTKNVNIRWNDHCRPYSECVKLSNAIQKYGKDAFEFTVLEECETLDQLNEREVHWIKELNTLSPNGYNLHTGGLNHVCSDETRLKLSLSGKGRIISDVTKLKMSLANIGKKLSDVTKSKLADARRGKRASEESRKKMSIAGKGRPKSQETRAKISSAKKGRKMAPLSEETRMKMSVARIKFIEEQIGKVISPEAESKRLSAWVARQVKKDEINPPTEKQLAARLYYKNLRAKNKLQKENL